MAERRHRWWRWLLIVPALLIVVVGAGAAYLLWPRTPTAITEDEALERFRGSTTTSVGPASVGPPSGVYTYDTDGREDIKMGPLPLPTREIPDMVTAVIAPDGACFRIDLNLMAEHTEESSWCVGGDGSLVMEEQVKREEVPGFHVETHTTCGPGTVISPTATELPVHCTMDLDVSGITFTIRLDGTARSEPGGTIDVGSTSVETRHLTIRLDASGDFQGHLEEQQWLTDDFLQVRTVRDLLLDGPGRFSERTTLTLRSLQPRT